MNTKHCNGHRRKLSHRFIDGSASMHLARVSMHYHQKPDAPTCIMVDALDKQLELCSDIRHVKSVHNTAAGALSCMRSVLWGTKQTAATLPK